MTPDTIFFIMAAMFAAIAAIIGLDIVFGYNLTKHDIEEGRILAICMELDAYIPSCWDLYGGIDTQYGEPLK